MEKGGLFVSYKSGNIQEELEAAGYAIQILGGRIKDTVKFKLPGSDMDRSLVVIEKIKETPARYPRRAGIPSREPLVRK